MQTSSTHPTVPPPLPPLYDSPSPKTFLRMVFILLSLVIFQNIFIGSGGVGLGTSLFIFSLLLSFMTIHPKNIWQPSTALALVFALATAVQFVIAPRWECYFSITILLLFFSGKISHTHEAHLLKMTGNGIKNLVLSVTRCKWFYTQYQRLFPSSHSLTGRASLFLQYTFRVFLPAAVVFSVFGILLLSSNAIMDGLYQNIMVTFNKWLRLLEFPSFQRIVFSLLTFILCLGLLWPRPSVKSQSPTTDKADTPCGRFAVLRNLLILAGLNFLYFAANTIDGIYLWSAQSLPEGMSYSRFVHQGTWNLIATVILAALLTTYFSAGKRVTGFPVIKNLCLLWIAQNLFLVTSVGLRLSLYIDAYQWTLQRFYLLIFLALVFTGFLCLAARIYLGKNLFWLCEKNVLTVFYFVFALQFFNVPGFIARENIDSHLLARSKNMNTPLDLNYLIRLGPASYPALIDFARQTPGQEESIKRMLRHSIAKQPQATWQGYQLLQTRNLSLAEKFLK